MENSVNAYATTSSNTAATSSTPVASVSDGIGVRQVVVLGAGDGTTSINDGSPANPINVTPSPNSGLALDSTLVRYLSALVRPVWYNPTTNSLKAEITSGVITTVTTVSAANVVGLGAGLFSASLTLLYTGDRNLFANAVRSNVA